MKVQRTDLFQKWLNSIRDKIAKAAIEQRIRRIEQDGYIASKPIIGFKNISEIRIDIGQGYRIYFNLYVKGDEVWLLNGGDKSTQRRDIKVAQKLLKEIEKERTQSDGRDCDYSRRR